MKKVVIYTGDLCIHCDWAIELLNRTYMTFSELMKLYEDMYNNHLKEDIDKYFKEVAEMQEKQRKENDEDNKQDSL